MINLDSVSYSYDPQRLSPVIHDITVDIPHGQYVALLGRNGSGKSTVARLLNGLQLPTQGSVCIDGHTTSVPHELPAVRRAVQLVFQNPENQQVGTTPYEDIAFGLANLGMPTDLMRERTQTALKQAGLDIELDRDTRTLSGGELQRLALASVLALEPHYLVLDEATSMLDPAGRNRFLGTLQRLTQSRQLGVIQITHHLEEIETADRAIVLIEGRIAYDGTPQSVLANGDLLQRAGLEAPHPITFSGTGHLWHTPNGGDTNPSLRLDSVSYRYGSVRKHHHGTPQPPGQLDNINMALLPGELVAIAGRSGAGKTTLLNVIKGIVKPQCGTVSLSGKDAWEKKHRNLFVQIGYVLQHPEHQLFAPTVRDDVAFALRGRGYTDEHIAVCVQTQLTQIGLDPTRILEESPFSLSGGQQRRVAMAGVLVAKPRILLLDEPTAGLDAPSRDALFSILHQAARDGTTVIWVSHRLEEIAEHATRLIVVDDGQIVANSAPAVVFADAQVTSQLGWNETLFSQRK